MPWSAECSSGQHSNLRPVNLFQPGDAPDDAYRNLRDNPRCVEWKAFCESLWTRFEPYADRHFQHEIRIQFHPRFWEMYLAAAFLDRGFNLHRHKDGGPEFGIDIEGKRYWFDAIAPTSGVGVNAVPDEFSTKRESRGVPTEQIILRYTSALSAKRDKWQKDLSSGRVAERDGYIVAINDRSIRWAWLGAEMPHIVKGLYGIGNLVFVFNSQTKELVESTHQPRPAIKKASGASISSQAFAARECPEVSAVLYGFSDAANAMPRLGDDFSILHNVEPRVSLPRGALRFAKEWWLDDEGLDCTNWLART